MATDVTICSNALQIIGASPINSFSEGSQANGIDTARLCSNLWPVTRDAVLRAHNWSCATARVVLSPESTNPQFGFSHRYILPSDWLRNVEINGVNEYEIDYRTETVGNGNASKRMLCDVSTLNLVYIWRNTDTLSWDAMLVEAAQTAMAAQMAYAVTQSGSLKEQLTREYMRKISMAKSVDGQDESPTQLGSFEILGARRSLGRSY